MNDDGPTLAQILAEAEAPALPPATVCQDAVTALLDAYSGPSGAGLTQFVTSDTLEAVRACLWEGAGRQLGHFACWVRFSRPDTDRSLLVVLHSPSPLGEADLLVLGHPGVMNRTVLRAALRWAFFACGWTRLVARVETDRAGLADLLRRAGFRHEGTARGGFNGLRDADVWALTLADAARFLPRAQRPAPSPIPTHDTSPPSSLRVH